MRRGELSQRQARRQAAPGRAILNAKKWPQPVGALSESGIERIHTASLRLLGEQGMEFMAPEAWDFLEPNGVNVDRETGLCKFPAEVVLDWVAKAPSRFRIAARDPALSLDIGGGHCQAVIPRTGTRQREADGRDGGTGYEPPGHQLWRSPAAPHPLILHEFARPVDEEHVQTVTFASRGMRHCQRATRYGAAAVLSPCG